MEKGHLYVRNVTISEPSPKESRVVAQTTMRGKGDPGYALTAGQSYQVDSLHLVITN